MKTSLVDKIERKNILHTITLLFSLFGFMFLLGWIIGGKSGVIIAAFICVLLLSFNSYRSTHLILKASRARLLDPARNAHLYNILGKLARRAGLTHLPRLYSMPSKMMNAFVIGKERDSSIVLTDSLLRHLNYREIAGIIGHEVAHIRNNDLWVMSVSDIAVRITHMISTAGQLILFLSLPAVAAGEVSVSLMGVLLLFFAPTICLFLQAALSRTREYEADRLGVELAGDVYGLASALQKLERYHTGLMQRLFSIKWMYTKPSLLLTHPPTQDRIKQLLEISEDISRGWPTRFKRRPAW